MTEEIEAIYSHLKRMDTSNGHQIAVELQWAITQLARSAELEADTYAILKLKQGEVLQSLLPDKLSPNTLKMVVESRTVPEATLYRKAERLNAAIVHAMDALRSLLSNEKAMAILTRETGR